MTTEADKSETLAREQAQAADALREQIRALEQAHGESRCYQEREDIRMKLATLWQQLGEPQ